MHTSWKNNFASWVAFILFYSQNFPWIKLIGRTIWISLKKWSHVWNFSSIPITERDFFMIKSRILKDITKSQKRFWRIDIFRSYLHNFAKSNNFKVLFFLNILKQFNETCKSNKKYYILKYKCYFCNILLYKG